MMTCKQAATLMSTGDAESASWRTRLSLWMHVAMCRHCRAFKRQLDLLANVGRALSTSHGSEPPKDFEAKLAERLTVSRRGDGDA
ncbi:MAG: zf-HC2 domain-containing protein [Vicinamibacterales bacterium]